MKRIITALLIGILLISLSLSAAMAEGGGQKHRGNPELYLTSVPAYGETTNVKGKVVYDDSSPAKSEAFRVTLFLQTSQNGEYWVKPTYAQPCVGMNKRGEFSLDCTTGGIDELAVTLHIFLIPANYTPSNFADTRSNAISYVRVDRAEGQANKYTPELIMEQTVPTLSPANTEELMEVRQLALDALSQRLSATEDTLYVYRDFSDAANHFTQKAKIAGEDDSLVKDMRENWQVDPYAGKSCIRCDQQTSGTDWGGWLFLNGTLKKGETVPQLTDGSQNNVGLNLKGAQELRFWARGAEGGERVEFFTAGFGYNGETGRKLVKYPDSMKKKSPGFVTLTKEWKEYVIPFTAAADDLTGISCGFGFVMSGTKGTGHSTFYLDEIRFTGDFSRQTHPMLGSYDTDNVYVENAAFSYDNALCAMAFLSAGRFTDARKILDSFVYAIENDRYAAGRVRNAYIAGDITAFPGWESGARLPGWYDAAAKTWYEDRYQVGCNTGNTSYVALALLQYDGVFGNDVYAAAAEKIMNWVLENCQDGTRGFTAGYDGWQEGETPVVYPLTYKSIEHNIDAYAAFSRLYERTGKKVYQEAANSALNFIRSMYDAKKGLFYTGTLNDGVTVSKENIVLDAQVWAALALGDKFRPYEKSISLVEKMRTTEGGYPFCLDNKNGGWWAEGTAYTALMYRLRGDENTAAGALNALAGIQLDNGLFPAATVDNLSTGFELFTGEDWVYSTDAHIAPAAWFIMATDGFNPYAF